MEARSARGWLVRRPASWPVGVVDVHSGLILGCVDLTVGHHASPPTPVNGDHLANAGPILAFSITVRVAASAMDRTVIVGMPPHVTVRGPSGWPAAIRARHRASVGVLWVRVMPSAEIVSGRVRVASII